MPARPSDRVGAQYEKRSWCAQMLYRWSVVCALIAVLT